MEYIDLYLNHLKTSEYNEYSTKYLPKVREWTKSNLVGKYEELLKQTQDEGSQLLQSSGSKALTPQQLINQINNIIKSGKSAVESAELEAKEKTSKDKEQIDLITANGATFSRYEEKWFVQNFGSGKSATSSDSEWAKQYQQTRTTQGKSEVFRQWKADRILIAPTETLNAIQKKKQEWNAQFNHAPSVPLYVTKAEADEYEKEMHTVVKSQMLGGAGHNDSTLYGADNVVMDFEVTPWSKIFPELTNTMAVDDSIEDNELTILKAVKEYTKIYRYLKVMSSLDSNSELSTIRNQSEGTYNEMLELEKSIQSAIENTSSTITFQGTNYDLSKPDSEKNLFDAISKLNSSSIMVNSNWYKVVKKLYDHGLLGSFGSFLGFKPKYPVSMNKIGLLTGEFNRLMTADEMNNTPDYYAWNDSGYKIYLDSLLKQRKGIKTSKNDELPTGIFTTSRTQNIHYSLDNTTYENAYLFDKDTNSVGQIALKDLPKNNRISGVIPAVLGSSGLDQHGNITKIGLLDSRGHIIGANPTQPANNPKYDANTLTYNLNLTTNYGKKETPAYELILNEGDGLVTEVDLKNRPEEWGRVNQILLGQGYAPQVWHAFQGEYVSDLAGINDECVYNNNHGGCWSDDRPKDDSMVTRMNFMTQYNILASATTTSTYAYSIEGAKNISFSKYLSSNTKKILGLNAIDHNFMIDSSKVFLYRTMDYYSFFTQKYLYNPNTNGLFGVNHFNVRWVDDRKEITSVGRWAGPKPGFSYGHERYKIAPYYQHKLMLIPVNKTVLSDMRNEGATQVLLPTYND